MISKSVFSDNQSETGLSLSDTATVCLVSIDGKWGTGLDALKWYDGVFKPSVSSVGSPR